MLKNITLSADDKLIERARMRAAGENRSLNDAFREWLEQWTNGINPIERYEELMARVDKVSTGRKFSRDEMNGR